MVWWELFAYKALHLWEKPLNNKITSIHFKITYFYFYSTSYMTITEAFYTLGLLQCIDRTGFTLHSSITIKREESFGLYLQILVLLSNVWKICWVESNQCYSADKKSEGERTNNQYFFLFQILILLVFVFVFANIFYVSHLVLRLILTSSTFLKLSSDIRHKVSVKDSALVACDLKKKTSQHESANEKKTILE